MDRRAGLAPDADGRPVGDGTVEFDGGDVPVWAVAILAIDLTAGEHVCRHIIQIAIIRLPADPSGSVNLGRSTVGGEQSRHQ